MTACAAPTSSPETTTDAFDAHIDVVQVSCGSNGTAQHEYPVDQEFNITATHDDMSPANVMWLREGATAVASVICHQGDAITFYWSRP